MALANSPIATDNELTADAEYPEHMTTSGYGGTASVPTGPDEEEEYDEEELTITDDDDEEDEELTDDEEEDDDV